MGVRKVGPPKITKSRLVEEETRAAGPRAHKKPRTSPPSLEAEQHLQDRGD